MKLYIILACLVVVNGKSQKTEKPKGRIVGGVEASIEKFPYMASVRKNRRHFCGGAIITSQHVLTAAHCLTDIVYVPENTTIVVGATSSSPETDGIIYAVRAILPHNKYDEKLTINDIGIITIWDKFSFNSVVKPIAIAPFKMEIPVGAITKVAGYGETQEKIKKQVINLKEVDLPVVDHKLCREIYSSLEKYITETMICTGFPEGGKDSCQGDSGGPLIYHNKVVGVVSFGYGCGIRGYPGIYTDVRYYNDWIQYVTELTTNI